MIQPNQTTLADLATRVPAASRVFRRHRLDYCCGGRRTIADACRERGLDPDAVVEEVERETAAARDPEAIADRPLDEIVVHIVARYHEPLRAELPELVAMARKVEKVHADKPGCPHGLAAQLEATHADLLDHMAKEEQVLFPMIVAGAGARAQAPITVMTREHDDHGATLRELRALTADYRPPEGACATWRALYLRLDELEGELMDHISLENNVLFPRALRGAR